MATPNDRTTPPASRAPGAGHVPHSDGFSAGVTGHAATVTLAVYTCEYTGESARLPDFLERGRRTFDTTFGPAASHAGQGARHEDRRFDLLIGYWLDRRDFEAWQSAHPWPQWCAATAADAAPHGYSREVFTVPAARLETLLSAADIRHGLSACGLPVVGPVMQHGYWGSMRDRLPAGAAAAAAGAADPRAAAPHEADLGAWGTSTVLCPPPDLCVICSGQDWANCRPDHALFFHEQLRPRLATAMAALQRRADAHGCVDLRMVDLVDERRRPRSASFALATFLSLGQLAHWARTDPDHLDIFGTFIAHKRASQTALRLWHEVLLLPGDGLARFEYLRCAPPKALRPAAAPSSPCATAYATEEPT